MEEEITHHEFVTRLMTSPCSFFVEEWERGNAVGKKEI